MSSCRATNANAALRVRIDRTHASVEEHDWVHGSLPLTITDPREAWETLAARGVLPFEAVDDPRRRFVCSDCDGRRYRAPVFDLGADPVAALLRVRALLRGLGLPVSRDDGCYAVSIHPADLDAVRLDARANRIERRDGGDLLLYDLRLMPTTDRGPGDVRVLGVGDVPCGACKAVGTAPHPVSVADAVAFASDWSGVLTAEALAREVTGCERVGWRVVAHDDLFREWTRGSRWLLPVTLAQLARDRCRGCAHMSDAQATDLLATGYVIDDVADGVVRLVVPGLA